jgi:hypothetical protein
MTPSFIFIVSILMFSFFYFFLLFFAVVLCLIIVFNVCRMRRREGKK